MKEDVYKLNSEFYYKRKKCKIIRNDGLYFVIVQFEDGTVDSAFKGDLKNSPYVPLKIKLIHWGEAILYYLTLGDYTPHFNK